MGLIYSTIERQMVPMKAIPEELLMQRYIQRLLFS